MAASITHRITGVALYFGTFLLTAWVVALVTNQAFYEKISACLGSIFGQIVMFLWAVAVLFHLFNGLRHLLWDGPNIGFDPKTASTWSIFNYLIAIVGAGGLWAAAYML